MKAILTGGGTGGHIYPGLAIAKGIEMNYEKAEILFVGTNEGLEAEIVPKAGYELANISSRGLPRKLSIEILTSLVTTGIGVWEAKKLINTFKPDIVIGTGGYVSGPVMLMASLMKKKTVIHEQNAYPGLTNRLLSRLVDKVALSNQDAESYFNGNSKLVLTGNPVRPEIIKARRLESYKELGLDPNKKFILVFGGSRGAKSINQAMEEVYKLSQKNPEIQVLHITGKNDFARVREVATKLGISNLKNGHIIIKPYLYNMAAGLAAADLVISRAGATGLAEITARGIPAILIPYPYAAENHQEHNARSLERRGAAKVILDHDLNGVKLVNEIQELIFDQERLDKMAKASKKLGKPKAVDNIIKLIDELI
ncbi:MULTISPECIES: undecaprenyldiphospho-muramoylpentapeptide beta-N-acetylglucosaminyltransferase [unclassified Candidatus Frackibacter]|uniref:undecaprenyldiphospho-muramoylpentapeptide beta-N-acetylglucosaminyltransferase n=1 Tax=unclassified Candidatus Frackibacter TaxID=2648818 RepID=UPI00087FAF83|nr:MULTISPECIES: undecaprenyldiphospho-muramoylpentapeptide beta-N-acetylglucosaminyltransferase [unclassified Candidatus Frackibacter]SDC35084.1 UDP-N-acetylglucosamine-N-acetylmuramylpentapeptide N-acetylglucosamine transferase [Candidatus Frackibacter sp. WG11]SEM56353.1 UDP-N-acetylglucosamine-N-acetylmuramylpentapeptide N-acetylglucosamine transferase [Candidatus Frackibacter sp. WG12]SFL70959.1 UDP-N-acetylglucosamine-N-acetylmuramylpentapeptide N-acetylglucosamine transferase [Candidatus 